LERRLAKCLNYLKKGEKYIRDELVTKGLSSEQNLDKLKEKIAKEVAKDTWVPKAEW